MHKYVVSALLPLLALSGCGGGEDLLNTLGSVASGPNPNNQPAARYEQTPVSIPTGINDALYTTNAPWEYDPSNVGISALTYLWSHSSLNVFPLYGSLALPAQELIVAVIDTGVDYTHEDLFGRMWLNTGESPDGKYDNQVDDDGDGLKDDFLGWNFVTDMNNPADDNGHGTHVSGTIAAIGNNGKGIVGVAPWVRIMPLKVCSAAGSCASSDIRAALDYAVEHGAKVVNISLGGVDTGPDSVAFDEAIADATAAGVLVVVAAGNSAIDTQYMSPANARYAVAVAAHRSDGAICSFSDYGFKLDVSAPGCALRDGFEVSGILSLNSKQCGSNGRSYCATRNLVTDGYTLKSGTSMATPHVVGMAAVALTASPTATPLQVRTALQRTATAIQAGKKNFDFGMGKLNATNLITEAQTAPGIKITSPRYGTSSGGAFTIGMRIEARANAVNWALRYQAGPFPDDVDLSGGTAVTNGSVSANTSSDFSASFTPPASGDYLLILEAIANGQKYHDVILVKRP